MIGTVLTISGIAGALVFLLLLIFRRDLVGVDLSGQSLLRLYLYLASIAGVIILVIGLASLLDWGTGTAFGNEAIYGRPAVEGPAAYQYFQGAAAQISPDQLRLQYAHEQQGRHDVGLITGIAFSLFGLLIWGGHHYARRVVAGADERTSALRRAYVTLGTFVFGLASIVLIAVGVVSGLTVALVHPGPDVSQPGVGDSLWGGIVALPIWAVYLRRLISDFRTSPRPSAVPVQPSASPTRA